MHFEINAIQSINNFSRYLHIIPCIVKFVSSRRLTTKCQKCWRSGRHAYNSIESVNLSTKIEKESKQTRYSNLESSTFRENSKLSKCLDSKLDFLIYFFPKYFIWLIIHSVPCINRITFRLVRWAFICGKRYMVSM